MDTQAPVYNYSHWTWLPSVFSSFGQIVWWTDATEPLMRQEHRRSWSRKNRCKKDWKGWCFHITRNNFGWILKMGGTFCFCKGRNYAWQLNCSCGFWLKCDDKPAVSAAEPCGGSKQQHFAIPRRAKPNQDTREKVAQCDSGQLYYWLKRGYSHVFATFIFICSCFTLAWSLNALSLLSLSLNTLSRFAASCSR